MIDTSFDSSSDCTLSPRARPEKEIPDNTAAHDPARHRPVAGHLTSTVHRQSTGHRAGLKRAHTPHTPSHPLLTPYTRCTHSAHTLHTRLHTRCTHPAPLCLHRYASLQPELLQPFLVASPHYDLDTALLVCREHGMADCEVRVHAAATACAQAAAPCTRTLPPP